MISGSRFYTLNTLPVNQTTMSKNWWKLSTYTHTHPFNGPFSGTTQVSQYQKGKPIWILLEQEIVSGSGISWAICKSAPCSRQTTMPAPHHSSFLQAGCPSCRPTNSVKALKARALTLVKIVSGSWLSKCQWQCLILLVMDNCCYTQCCCYSTVLSYVPWGLQGWKNMPATFPG